MILLKPIVLSICLIAISCGKINFIYSGSENITSPLYNKAIYTFTGDKIPNIYRFASRYLGVAKDPEYRLNINVEETKTKRAVGSNQAVSKLDYDLTYDYTLKRIGNDCVILDKRTFSKFSYVPKSSGYNFGSDQSLEKMYELASKKSLEVFVNALTDINLSSCDNEE
tara:strand:- start:144 stop:647 length:504 start_codon:yes stop_codon:yes gene_type:complete